MVFDAIQYVAERCSPIRIAAIHAVSEVHEVYHLPLADLRLPNRRSAKTLAIMQRGCDESIAENAPLPTVVRQSDLYVLVSLESFQKWDQPHPW